jgi:hypothetical protein
MIDGMTPTQFARWLMWVCLLMYCILITLKARKAANRAKSLRMMNKAYKDILKDANEENSRHRYEKDNLEFQLRQKQTFCYDLEMAPSGTLQLLTRGGARLIEPLGSVKRAQDMGIVAWATVARRDKDEEVRLGLVPPL